MSFRRKIIENIKDSRRKGNNSKIRDDVPFYYLLKIIEKYHLFLVGKYCKTRKQVS